ncbi:glycosyltransferase family 2 protein [Pseudomonas putida]|uniref:glycosyltransferase family 2 protein n=1 Tax=Pseudomonas putida TaxID=303 RepID=UPI0023632C56|nr:glycosyltransferase family 2 protein [Pseudomonas putida]MDD2147381.1 glycosyltransferase family 2 protein [Pseudomonas putida]HDS1709659.1 glycosyltransferase family 2 protein [Pseudomonas putida]
MIIIPMAGLSSRFFKAGYDVPKYMLELSGVTVFSKAVLSFKKYFNSEKFLFVVRDIYDTPDFVARKARELGILDFEIIVLDRETRGQAETVYLASKTIEGDESIIVFNIDTFRPNYTKPSFIEHCDGYLEVFSAPGEHWSFILPKDCENVSKTTEKDRVSDLCSDGLYYFKSKCEFEYLYEVASERGETVKGEYYIAPLYNSLIERGKVIKYQKVELSEIEFCGTPEEYEALKSLYQAG